MREPTEQGHRERVVRLYREFGPVVYRRCVRLLGDREAARDATQEVFVKLLREVTLDDDGQRALRWIYRVTTNHCLNLRRDRLRRARAIGAAAEDALDVVGEAEAPYPERQLAQRVLGRFDATTQAIAVGVLVDGMEREEVAGALGISRRTVHRKLTRFLEGARRLLVGEGP
jgi:RNA polymerase sigma-70 factor, ECF subfamily